MTMMMMMMMMMTMMMMIDPWQGLPIYFGSGMRTEAWAVLNFLCANIMMTLVTAGLAWCCVALNRQFSVASLIANTNYTFIGLTRYDCVLHTRNRSD
jgi:hypothetical protein